MSDVVQKLWGFCHTLRHDGIDYGDYIEQITFLLFLKMADEKGIELPAACDWPTLRDKNGSDLTDHYTDTLRELAKTEGILGDIYAEAQSRFNNPVNLKRLINLIDETEWTSLGVDVKAEAYEGLLEKAASEGKKGAGQYFTPPRPDPVDRALHEARPAGAFAVHNLRPGLRHGGLSGGRLRVADGPNARRGVGARHCAPREEGHVLRPGPGCAPAPAGPDEPLPARP
jgi:hypothetical protein